MTIPRAVTETDPRLRRREALRAGVTALSFPVVGSAAAGRPDGTDAPATFEPLGTADVNGAREAVVAPDGDAAFVATVTGFVTVDISDPRSPSIAQATQHLTDDEGEDLQQVFDVKYDDGQLIVPSAAQGARPRGFYMYDVTDPTGPTRVGDWFHTPEHGIHNCDLEDGVAYLTGNTRDGPKVVAVDVSEPPFETLGEWQPGDWKDEWATPPNTVIHDLYAQGEYVYAAYWDAGTFVLDASDPANMTFVSRVGDYTIEELREIESRQTYLEPKGNDHYVTVNEDATIMAEGGESWNIKRDDDTGGPSGITIYDISEKSDPERLAHISPPTSDNNTFSGDATWTTSHNFDISGGRLYASWYQAGVSVHDISDPSDPKRIAWWMNEDRSFWTAQLAVDGGFFIGSASGTNGTTTGLLTFPDDAGGRVPDRPETVEWPTPGNYPSVPEEETTTDPSETTTDPGETTTDSGGTTATGSRTGTEATDAPTDGTDRATTTPDTTTSEGAGGASGPGLLGALAGVGAGAYLLGRRRGDDE